MGLFFKVDLPKRARKCAGDGQFLVAGETCYSLLKEAPADEKEPYVRHDYCKNCWSRLQIDLDTVVTHWKGRVPHEEAQIPDRTKEERALALLKELIAADNYEAHQQAYILALFLVRQRLLALRRELVQDDGTPVQLYEAVETEEMFCLKKIDIASLPVVAIQKALASQLR